MKRARFLDDVAFVVEGVLEGVFSKVCCEEFAAGVMAAMAAAKVVWNREQRRFASEDGLAYLAYNMRKPAAGEEGKEVMDVVHTYVPVTKRGLGLAGELCKVAFEHAREQKLLVLPSCSYVSDTYIPRHPECWDVVVPESLQRAGL